MRSLRSALYALPSCSVVRLTAALLLLTAFVPATAAAQEDPIGTARFRLGPVGVTPSIALTDVGVDSNVFNEVENPRQDFTATLSPQADTWLRAGPTRAHVRGSADLVYFQRYASERSVDGKVDVRIEAPGNRITPWIQESFSVRRQRAGYEIDLRSRTAVNTIGIGLGARVFGSTNVEVSVGRSDHAYDDDAVFLGSSLSETLGRSNEFVAVEYRQSLTPLTTFVVRGETGRDRFAHLSSRDSDSVKVLTGFDLGQRALVSGSVRVGFRKFDGVGGGLPNYRGLIAAVGAAFTVAARTRVEVGVDRDINYSFERSLPYYVATGFNLVATPRLTDSWDVQARVGGQRLAYRAPLGQLDVQDRADAVFVVGGGIGYRIGQDMRIGVNVDRQQRSSLSYQRDYKGYRIGTSITYGR